MKTNNIRAHGFMIIVLMLSGYYAQAQQAQSLNAATVAGKETATGYTYKLLQAPNKMYGYDILMNNKIILHQPAASPKQDNSALVLTKKEQAEKAASFMISKMKSNQPATLTKDEIKQLNAAK